MESQLRYSAATMRGRDKVWDPLQTKRKAELHSTLIPLFWTIGRLAETRADAAEDSFRITRFMLFLLFKTYSEEKMRFANPRPFSFSELIISHIETAVLESILC